METVNGSYMLVDSTFLMNDGNEVVLNKLLKQTFLKEIRSENLRKHKGRILIQDNVEMIQCKGNCGKYNRHK